MPYTLTIDTTTSLAYIRGHGMITPNDVRVALNDLATAGATHLALLVDVRDAMVHFFPAEVQECVDLRRAYQAQYGSVRTAAIAAHPVSYGVLYMYQSLSAGRDPDFKIFLSLPEALEWLRQSEYYAGDV